MFERENPVFAKVTRRVQGDVGDFHKEFLIDDLSVFPGTKEATISNHRFIKRGCLITQEAMTSNSWANNGHQYYSI